MDHVMLDLETMGVGPMAVIASIGACVFDPYKAGLGDSFYINVGLRSCVDAGLKFDPETVEWWLRQDLPARRALAVDQAPLRVALARFRHFYADAQRVWANGATFDPVILENAYLVCGSKPPWSYRDVRDTRTVYELAGINPWDFPREDGIEHYALADACHQARVVQHAYRRLLGKPSE